MLSEGCDDIVLECSCCADDGFSLA
jgi:hypothetical protein